jgi:hypothetical protein
MSNYTKTTDFEAKDSLPTGDSGKIIRGAEFETEFDAISTAIATKADTAGPTFTGTLTFETISDGTIGVTAFVDEDDMSSDSATLVPTQQSVKAYVDSQVTAQDLDFQADSGGALSIDLDSETLTFTGGTGIDTSGLGNAVTFAIDSTVATLTGSQTLTNKTLTSPDVNTPDIDGGTIDGTVIGGTTAAAGSFTTVSATGNITVDGTVDGRDVATDGTKLDTVETNADVTDTANVTAAGALMDSELTSEASVKALNQGVATTDSPTFAGVTVNGTVEFDGLSGTGAVNVTDILDQDDMLSNSATALATQQSIKAYVDSQVATVDTLAEVLGNGNTTGGTDIAVGTGDDITFADSSKAIFGAGSDLQIFHDPSGPSSVISDQGAGDLILRGSNQIRFQDATGAEHYAIFNENGAVQLYYDNAEKLATTSTGIDVTGVITTDGMTTSADINFGDNDKAVFGAGSDLQIYHDGSNSYINDTGTGNLFVCASDNFYVQNAGGTETKAAFTTDGAVKLYYNGGTKFQTVAGGVDVTGTVTADGLTVDGSKDSTNVTISAPLNTVGGGNLADYSQVLFDNSQVAGSSGQAYVRHYANSHNDSESALAFGVTTTGGTTHEALRIGGSGDISFYEDTGTTAKFFWDASAEALGIGSTSPDSGRKLHIEGGDTTVGITLKDTAGTQYGITSDNNSFTIRNDSLSSDRLVIDTSGNVGIGRTPDTVYAGSLQIAFGNGSQLATGTSGNPYLTLTDNSYLNASGNHIYKTSNPSTRLEQSNGTLTFSNAASGTAGNTITYAERMRIDSSGNVGIGVTNVGAPLDIGTSNPKLRLTDSDGGYSEVRGNGGVITLTADAGNAVANSAIAFETDGSEAMRIDSSGNVGIGATSLSNKLTIDAALSHLRLQGASNANKNVSIQYNESGDYGQINCDESGVNQQDLWITGLNLKFGRNISTERMRIDSSGNLLVGKTSADTYNNTNGIELQASGLLTATRTGIAQILNREDSDGDIAVFRKDGTTVGSIGARAGDLAIGTGNCGLIFNDGTEIIIPANITTNAVSDAAVDLGYSAGRFKDLYLSGASLAGAGSASSPSISFSGDTNTGLYSVTADNIGFATAGTARAFMSSTQFNMTGNGVFSGSITKGSGSFKIDHPLPAKTDTHHLVHSFVEAPQADNIYRGVVDLVNGSATINIDTVAGMTEGTFVLLNTNLQCFTSNESGWTAVKGSVSGNTLTITAQDNTCTDTISWMVVGERHDQHMIDTEWTDSNGKVIVEPEKL